MVPSGRQPPSRPTPTSSTTCTSYLYRDIRRRMGCSFKRFYSLVLALKHFEHICRNQTVLIESPTGNTTCSLHKQGRASLCPSLEKQYFGSVEHADKLSRHKQVIQTEWSLHQGIFNQICQRLRKPQIDLFSTRFNSKLPEFVSPVPDKEAWAVDSLSLSGEDMAGYAFLPTPLVTNVKQDLQAQPLEHNSHSSGLAQHVVVLEPGEPVIRGPLCLP